jgi:hypothetical protein
VRSRCYARWETPRPKNSAHGQKIALTTIVDQTNNFATARAVVLPSQSGITFATDLQAPESPRRGCDPGVLESYGAFERVMRSSDHDLKSWKLTRKQFRRCCEAAYEELKR